MRDAPKDVDVHCGRTHAHPMSLSIGYLKNNSLKNNEVAFVNHMFCDRFNTPTETTTSAFPMSTDRTEDATAVIGIDIDGTITLDPAFYSAFTRNCKRSNIVVHIVSARPPESRVETEAELQELDIVFDELHLLPSMEEAITLCPHSEIEWFDRHAWMKIDYAVRKELSHFVDDNERVLRLFRSYAPQVTLVAAEEYSLLRKLFER